MQMIEVNIKMLLHLLASRIGGNVIGPVSAIAGHIGIRHASRVPTICPSVLGRDRTDHAHQYGSEQEVGVLHLDSRSGR